MSFQLPRFTPLQDESRVQIRFPPDNLFPSMDTDTLWTARYNPSTETWGFEDTQGFFGGVDNWTLQWSSNSEYVFLYRIEEIQTDPNAPIEGQEPPGYVWLTNRVKYLGRTETNDLELVDQTESSVLPDIDTFGWKFRNENFETLATIATRIDSATDTETSTVNHVRARIVRLPTLDVTEWETQSPVKLKDVRAETANIDTLNVQTLGTFRPAVTFRDRARILIENPSRTEESFLGLSDPDQWIHTNNKHTWLISNPVLPSGWTITSIDSGASQTNVQFLPLNSRPGYFLVRPENNQELFLRHDLVWEDATNTRNDPNFESSRVDLHWDVTANEAPATEDRYVQSITGSLFTGEIEQSGIQTLRHKTLAERNLSPVETPDLVREIQTDSFGHVVGITPYDDTATDLARRASVFQFEQRGWDAVGTANDLELFQDWMGVTEDQFKRSWWTESGFKAAIPTHVGGSSLIPGALAKKFVGAITNPEGLVFCVPHQSSRALVFDPQRYTTQELSIGSSPGDFAGGVMTENGKVALIPHNKNELWFVRSPTWIPPNSNTERIALPSALHSGTQRFYGGARMTEGEIVCAPYNADDVAIYDTRIGSWSVYVLPSFVLAETNQERYREAVACPDGQVVCIPHEARTFLHVVENTTLVQRLPEPSDGLYSPSANPFITYPPGAFGTVSALSHRQTDVSIVIDARFPTPEEITEDMCLFNAGETVRSVWIGVRRLDPELVEFYARAGDSSPPPDNSATIVRLSNPSFLDGQVHRLLVDVQTDPGQLRVFVDDLLQGQRNISVRLADAAPDPPQWAGPGSRNMYGGIFPGETAAVTPFDETGNNLSNANWYGFPHSLLSPVRLYTDLRTPNNFLLPRAARQNWAYSWLQPIDTPELDGYDSIAPVLDSEVGTVRWKTQHGWGELVDSTTFSFYEVSIEPSLLAYPRVPRLVSNIGGVDDTHPQWLNWTFTTQTGWTCQATSEDEGNFEAFRAFQDENTLWRSATFAPSQTLTLNVPNTLRPRGYTLRAHYDTNASALRFVPLEWKLYGTNGGVRTELHHALPDDYPFNNSSDPESRTVTILLDMEMIGSATYSSFELEILNLVDSNDEKVALERWDMLFYPDETDGLPAWNTMNKNTTSASDGWRIFGTNVEGVALDITYHEPRRLHAIEVTSGIRRGSENRLGIKRVAIEAKNKTDFFWRRITDQPETGQSTSWTDSFQTVQWALDEPSDAYEMFRLVVTESDDPTYVCVQEWNLRTSQALPVEDMFANVEPFLLETGDTHEQPSPAYWGGTFTSRGIVCAPFESSHVGIYDISTRRLIQGYEVGSSRYAGARTLSNGLVALIPYDENANLLIYDPTLDTVLSEHTIAKPDQAFASGALTFDGQLVLAPYNAPDVRTFDVGILPHPALVTHPSVN